MNILEKGLQGILNKAIVANNFCQYIDEHIVSYSYLENYVQFESDDLTKQDRIRLNGEVADLFLKWKALKYDI